MNKNLEVTKYCYSDDRLKNYRVESRIMIFRAIEPRVGEATMIDK